MLNQIVLVGRIANDLKLKQEENGVEYSEFKLAVPRAFKNADGEYETDFVPIQTFKGVAKSTVEYCKIGDVIGVKGRLQIEDKKLVIAVEKISFLSTSKNEGDED